MPAEIINDYPEAREAFETLLGRLQKYELSDTTPLFEVLFGDKDFQKALSTFLSRPKRVAFGRRSMGEAVAYLRDGTIHWTAILSDPDYSLLSKTSFYVHETRHLFGGGHVPCPALGLDGVEVKSQITGRSLEGRPGCDSGYRGAYAFQAVFLGNIAKFCLNCSPEEKDEANFQARYFLRRIVDPSSYAIVINDLNLNRD